MTVSTLSEMTTTVTSDNPMTGADLLNFVKKAGGMSKTEVAMATGYYSNDKDGKPRCNFARMQDALLVATGINLGGGSDTRGPGGRKLSYVAKVQSNSNLLIGAAYTKKLGLEPGAEFQIRINKSTGKFTLVPLGSEEDTDD